MLHLHNAQALSDTRLASPTGITQN